MELHHYFNKENGPFRSISDLPEKEAQEIWHKMVSYLVRRDGGEYNPADFNEMIDNRHSMRRDFENEIRKMFIEKGGNAIRNYPYYMILSKDGTPDNALLKFYENGDYISIPVQEIDIDTVSFTYGDSFAQYYGSEFNKEEHELVYTYDEILKIIDMYGWVKKNANNWGFVEAQLWSDVQINKYKNIRYDVM